LLYRRGKIGDERKKSRIFLKNALKHLLIPEKYVTIQIQSGGAFLPGCGVVSPVPYISCAGEIADF
jgi:hypothetical protein